MRIADITLRTLCPGVRDGVLHYPRTSGGQPVTMPGERGAYGIEQRLILALCGESYLVAPRNDAQGECRQVHAVCVELLRRTRAADQPCRESSDLRSCSRQS